MRFTFWTITLRSQITTAVRVGSEVKLDHGVYVQLHTAPLPSAWSTTKGRGTVGAALAPITRIPHMYSTVHRRS